MREAGCGMYEVRRRQGLGRPPSHPCLFSPPCLIPACPPQIRTTTVFCCTLSSTSPIPQSPIPHRTSHIQHPASCLLHPASCIPHPASCILLLAEGPDWLVVSKPAHLLVHPTKPGGPVTLLDLLRQLLAGELASAGTQVSLIHRLDRETSGAVLVAKTPAAARRFSLDMMRGRITKEYLALVWGWPEWDALTVDAPLLRQGTRLPSAIWLKQMVHPDGAAARTRLEIVRRFERDGGRFALVRAHPETGRTHQIRVHLASRGHPVVGDKIYGPDEGCYLRFIETGWTPELARVLLLDRHALHAHRLEFDAEPGRRIMVEAPLPPDLAAMAAPSR